MRAVVGMELRQLLVIAVPMWIVAGIVAASEIAGSRDHTEDMVGLAIAGGLALGLAQGLLDQLHRNDDFLRHRPLSADRLQLARTVPALVVLLVGLLVFFASLWIATWIEAWQLARVRARVGADFLEGHDPIYYDAATHALVAALAVGGWAVARFTVGLRPYALAALASLVVPVAAWALLARAPTPAAAAGVAVLLALLFSGLVHTRETGRRGPIPRALLLGLLLLVGLEAALWTRSGLAELQRQCLPSFGLAEDGTVRYWTWSWDDGEAELDARRRILRRWPRGHIDDAPSRTLSVPGSLYGEDDSLAYERMDDPRFVPDAREVRDYRTYWGHVVASGLTRHQAIRRAGMAVPVDEIVYWSYGNGRLLCRRGTSTRELLAWVDPDGFHEGRPSPSAPRFPDAGQLLGYDREGDTLEVEGGPWTILSNGEAGSFLLRVVDDPEAPPQAPVQLTVENRPFTPYAGPLSNTPTVLPDGRRYWLLDRKHGLLAPRALRDDEYHPGAMHARGRRASRVAGGLETWLAPQHPTRYGARLRRFDQDGREFVDEVHLAPTTTIEKVPEKLLAILGVVRPPLLNAWAYVSEGPRTRSEMNRWWWRDPLFSSSSYGAWLLASFLLGGLMALFARRSARWRLATRAAQRRWILAVFLLGPLGLLWMKLAIGRTAVLPVGDGSRAVDLDRTPDNPAPWPEPPRLGTEVFARD